MKLQLQQLSMQHLHVHLYRAKIYAMIENEAKSTRTSSHGWAIQRIARRLDTVMNKRLSAFDLTLQQFAVLMTVLEADGLTQAEISKRFHMPPYAISRALDHLEKARLLQRRPHPASRRAYTIHCTEKGRALGPELFLLVREVNDELARPLTADERAQFGKLLAKLV